MTPDERRDDATTVEGDEPEPATAPSSAPSGSDQNWLLGTDVSRHQRDRQVLVVGDTVVGLTLTLLLQRAGYDPVLVSDSSRPVESRTMFLCSPACRVLRSLGASAALSEQGVSVSCVAVKRATGPTELATFLPASSSSDDTGATVVERRRLRDALATCLPNRQRSTGRALARLSTRDDGLRVEFADGIVEWFDVLVDASRDGTARRLAGAELSEHETLVQYETSVTAESLDPTQLWDVWHSNALVQMVPASAESTALVRLTAPRDALPRDPDGEWFRALLGESGLGVEGDSLSVADLDTETTTVHQLGLSECGQQGWWGTGRVWCCGPPAYPAAPATGFTTWFGIESALAVVSELNQGNRRVSNLLASYTAQRRRRLDTLRRTVRAVRGYQAYSVPAEGQAWADALGEFRQLTLSSFLDSRLESVRNAGFS